ncbi:uncharacterized protein C11orf24-like [Mobula hypostoma]|uniref:uncharacterized protein C11orf24-like n=1 Tax=Mobula hypostoma TaxID=723540 RepID=UPI002FC32385
MWTPLSLFLYVSICFLTESSMYKLQNSGIKVLKFLPISDGEECNRTCEFVTDQGGLKCNWVVIEENQNQNLCFYLHCLDISVCKEAAVEAVKDLQIGKYSPLKNLHHAGRVVREDHSPISLSVNNTSINGTGSTTVTNSSTESNEVSSTNTTEITATAAVSTAGRQFTGTPGASSSSSPSLPISITTTPAAPTTSNSEITATEVSSITTASTINSEHLTTRKFSEVSTPHESTASIVSSQQTTPVPTSSSKHESSVTPRNILKDNTTSLRSTPITTPKTTQSLTTVTPMEVSTSKLIPETEQKQTWTNASTIAGGVSQSPKLKSRTTVAVSNGKSYVFPSVPAGALIKYLADTSSLMAILIFGVLFFLLSIILFAHKVIESYKRKDYVQVDYLINGMYADSDM